MPDRPRVLARLACALPVAVLALASASTASDSLHPDSLSLECDAASVPQGGLVRCLTAPNARVEVDGVSRARADGEGRATIGVGRDAEGTLRIQAFRGRGEEAGSAPVAVAITDQPFAFSVVPGLDCAKVSVFTKEQLADIRAATAKKNAAVTVFAEGPGAHEGFLLPAEGRRSSPYGTRRRLEGVQDDGETCQKVRTHWGLDIAAPTGTPVIAPAPGVVTLADELYFEGNAIFLDHGHGLMSVFMHLSELDVVAGEEVAAGEVVGKIGATGTATGPHLHWGLKVRNPVSDNRSADFYVDPAVALRLDE
ncbi:MAG: M23 family metallopeptidase [Caulobacterales bacterium]|nr:M23 family metallopeptidase [Caulobacterales bacterium]